MNNLLFIKDNTKDRREEYEALICKRDQLRKEARSLQIAYTKEFGQMIIDNFELKIECIKTKKLISACQKEINCGRKININTITSEVDMEMMAYYKDLQDMMDDNERAKDSKTVGDYRIRISKQIYRRLAKILHPDMNAMTMEKPALEELWIQVENAYIHSDVEELEDLEAIVSKVMKELGEEGFKSAYTDIEKRIERVERQIAEILTTEPYIYDELLRSDELMEKKKKELDKEKKEYEGYLKELKDVLNDLLGKGGMGGIWLTEKIL